MDQADITAAIYALKRWGLDKRAPGMFRDAAPSDHAPLDGDEAP